MRRIRDGWGGVVAWIQLLVPLVREAMRGRDYVHLAILSPSENRRVEDGMRLVAKRAHADRLTFSEYLALSAALVLVYAGGRGEPLTKTQLTQMLVGRRRYFEGRP